MLGLVGMISVGAPSCLGMAKTFDLSCVPVLLYSLGCLAEIIIQHVREVLAVKLDPTATGILQVTGSGQLTGDFQGPRFGLTTCHLS